MRYMNCAYRNWQANTICKGDNDNRVWSGHWSAKGAALFEKQNLNNLKSLHFDIKKSKIELVDNEEEIDTTGVVGTGD